MKIRLLVLISIIFILFISGCIQKSELNVGEEAELYIDGEKYPFVAVDEKSIEELSDAAYVNDTIGWNNVFNEGKAYKVVSGTKVLVLDKTHGYTKFRIIEKDSKHYGEVGWAYIEHVLKIEAEHLNS